MNHQEEVLNEEGLLHGEEEVTVLLTPIGTLKIRMMEMKDMDMEEVVVEPEVKAMDEVETLDRGKQQRKSFKKYNQRRASLQLELVHSNVCGPIKPISSGENKIEDITPEEAWSLCKPKVDHLRTFGSITYAKVQEEKRTKLEDKSQKYILLGYFENASGYKLYNPITQKLMVSRDMEFDEEQAWNWNNNNDDDMKQISFEEDYKDKQGESEELYVVLRLRVVHQLLAILSLHDTHRLRAITSGSVPLSVCSCEFGTIGQKHSDTFSPSLF
ncbi:hypothetical protein ZIOFF_065482 [Zingiber officinale]|uniref:Retroviral polymerase SH3-like domain-containing protein n=1 Tax=Zingiber officinale TaxID=94328 RepID=A0A8J5EX66_ZINOF|nr:hypothetical protein ZIOFF_065482 [Zingiber officinale]